MFEMSCSILCFSASVELFLLKNFLTPYFPYCLVASSIVCLYNPKGLMDIIFVLSYLSGSLN